MLSSITPLGERARGQRWWLTISAYVVGSVLGGLTIGTVLGLLGLAVPDGARATPYVLVGAAVLLLLALGIDIVYDLRDERRGLPSWRRQVDEAWLGRYRGWVTGVGFGYQLGLGVVTIITSATTYAVLLLAVLAGGPGAGALIGATFGLVRALPSLLLKRVERPDQLRNAFQFLARMSRPVDMVAKLSLALGAVALMTAAKGW